MKNVPTTETLLKDSIFSSDGEGSPNKIIHDNSKKEKTFNRGEGKFPNVKYQIDLENYQQVQSRKIDNRHRLTKSMRYVIG